MPPWLAKIAVWLAAISLVGIMSFFVMWNMRQNEWIWELRERVLRLEIFYEHSVK